MIDTSRMTAYPGGYFTGTVDALAEEGLLAEIRTRRRQLSQMTTAYDSETAKRRIPDGAYHVSRKVDGEFTCLVLRRGQVFTLNPGGTLRLGAPFMDEAARALKDHETALIAGELYVQRPDGLRPRVHDVVRVARNPASAEEVGQLGFAAFDIFDLDGTDLSPRYAESIARLEALFGGGTLVHPVETLTGENAATVLKAFKTWVLDEGAEGVVARSPTAGIYKVKPRHSLDLVVVGYSEGLDDRSGMIHDLLCAVVRPTGRYHLLARVGGGFSDVQRSELLKRLSERKAASDFSEVNSDRVAYQMVEPGLVIEIECLDIMSTTSRGNTIDKMVLEWTESGWDGMRRLPLASLLSPQFLRLREDKAPGPETTGMAQLTAIVEIPEVDRVAVEEKLPTAEILAREAFVKTMKGATMVRKFMVIQTNKAEVSSDFPAYVLHVTDFSPNRAERLQTEVKVSSDKGQIMELFEAAKAEKVKSGWNPA